jgi:hypothetical protein
MTRKPVSKEMWAELLKQLHNEGMGEIHMKGFTEEEENAEMRKTFQEITELGYGHIHTLKVIPADGREPYFVHSRAE